jgi:DNA-directed RNA polymerase subunit RPC12/RpoP
MNADNLDQPWPCEFPPTTVTDGAGPLAPAAGSVLPWWVKYKWNGDAYWCVRCSATMRLNPDCEWDDDDEYNLCRNCSLELLKEAMARLDITGQSVGA